MNTTSTAHAAAPPAESGPRPSRGDSIFRRVTAAFGILLIVLIAWIILSLASDARSGFSRFGIAFLWRTDWDPVRESFGAAPFVFGTLVSSFLALLLAVPVALGIAVYLTELAPPRIRRPLGFVVELLAAVPSVVYGLWGIFILAPWMRETVQPKLESTLGFLPLFQGPHLGYGMLTAGVILAIMILPTISSVMREVLVAVPGILKENALALGATRVEAISQVVLPFARSGMVGATMLGLGRALGETMAVTMIIGNRADISASLFAPSYTMASVIANEYAEAASGAHLTALTTIGLLLFAVTFVLNVVARLLVWRVGRLPEGARS
ncbi:MAG: phosphate ABC transporter permease subunit PstC [Myxococcales bacterium]|nr:phosphate ABC transporter permease subunit PstC [Myxococcales bacterium]